MSFLGELIQVAAPIVGGIFGGVPGAAVGGAISGLVGGGGLKGAAVGAAVGGGLGYLSQGAFGGGGFGGGGESATSGYWNGTDFSGTAPTGAAPGGGYWNGTDFTGTTPVGLSPGSGNWNGTDFTGGASPVGGPTARAASAGRGGLAVSLGRTAAGLYAISESERLRRMMRPPSPGDVTNLPGYQAGIEAVMRSMSAQGYQGSGNMMAALSKYGGDFYNQEASRRISMADAQSGPAFGAISGLGLLSAGLGGFGGR